MAIPTIKSTLERGLPVSLSRWTDVADWYMDWLKDMLLNKGVIPAQDPKELVLSFWSAKPDEVHSLFFWTKNPAELTEAQKTWLSPYRVFTAVTITGWEEVETRVPPLDKQIEAFDNHLDLVGLDKIRWRYSPIPNDFLENSKQQDRFSRLCKHMSSRGIEEVDISLLQPSPHWDKGYANEGEEESEKRLDVLTHLIKMAGAHDIRVGSCADDVKHIQKVSPELSENVFVTKCLDREKLDDVFGLDTERIDENGCECQLSIDPCKGKQFGCASGCEYCYVPFTNVPEDNQ